MEYTDISNNCRIVLRTGTSKKTKSSYYAVGLLINDFYINLGFLTEKAYKTLLNKIG